MLGIILVTALCLALIILFVVKVQRRRTNGPTVVAVHATPAPASAQQPPYAYVQVAPTNTMAILALIFAFVFCPLGIVFGHIARRQIRERGESGHGLATAGLVLGYVFTGLQLILWIGFFILFAHIANAA